MVAAVPEPGPMVPSPHMTGGTEDWLYLKPLFLAEIGVARAIRAPGRPTNCRKDINDPSFHEL